MKTRIISALVGLIILGVAIAFYDTIIFNLFITALAVIGIYEGHHAASLTKKHWRVTLYSMLFAVLILLIPHGRSYIMPAVYALVVLVFAYILEHHKVFTIREGAYALLMGVGLPVVFCLILQFRDQFGNEQGILYLAFLLGSAWWSDIGGYFTGDQSQKDSGGTHWWFGLCHSGQYRYYGAYQLAGCAGDWLSYQSAYSSFWSYLLAYPAAGTA